MIHCILLNPTIDKIFHVNQLVGGGTYNIEKVEEFPVGKAISVALTLRTLERPVQVVALIGEHQLSIYRNFLELKGIPSEIYAVNGDTRSNITVVDDSTNKSTHFRLPGFTITKNDLKNIYSYLANKINAADFVVFSGSCPSGTPTEFFFEISPKIIQKHAYLIIDTSGIRLQSMLLYNPYLIKANLEEMGQILGHPLISTQELSHKPSLEELYTLLDQMQELARFKTEINILTLGSYGSIIFSQEHAYYAVLQLENAPYTVGSGDAYLGGVLASIKDPGNLPGFDKIARLATACGAANTQTLGAGILKKEDVDRFYSRVQITQMK